MSDDVPALAVSATELWQWAQAVNAIATLAARLRARVVARREQVGRLAFSDEAHAALQHEARQLPAVRLMTEAELGEWRERVPESLRSPRSGESLGVWSARMVDSGSSPTGEWGLEAHAWADGMVGSSVFVVCRDAADAVALTRHLREYGTVGDLKRLHALAALGFHELAVPDVVEAAGDQLSEADWAAALRARLPAAVADRIVVTDPAHRHHRAWQELYRLAAEEVRRVGANPLLLAMAVHRGARWHAGVKSPPALAHWALTQARTLSDYVQLVAGRESDGSPAAGVGTGLRLVQVRHPEQAVVWAQGLREGDPEHRVEAKAGFGRWGSVVDAILSRTFPGLVHQTLTAARRRSTVHGASAAVSASRVAGGFDAADPAGLVEETETVETLAAEVARLDPNRGIDRRAAHIMVGRVPVEIDRLIAAKFAADPQIAVKVRERYPDGIPDPSPAATVTSDEQHGLAARDRGHAGPVVAAAPATGRGR